MSDKFSELLATYPDVPEARHARIQEAIAAGLGDEDLKLLCTANRTGHGSHHFATGRSV